MTELEIINYLKENGTKGVAYGFMPQDVRKWCKDHRHEPIFQVYVCDDIWSQARPISCRDDKVYSYYDN